MNTSDTSARLVIYEQDDRQVEVRLDAQRDTVWLSQRQMADLFETSSDNISLHLRNIFTDGELNEEATAEDSSVVRQEGKRQVTRKLRHYNLDAIISVGYRISSRRAVQFRQWATRTLREHLTQGYTLNRQRLETNARELEAALQLVKKAAQSPDLLADTGRGLVDIVTRYAQTFLLLQRFDEGLLTAPPEQRGGVLPALSEARQALALLKRAARRPISSPANAAMPSMRCWAIWIRPCSASRPIPAWRRRRRICSTSSSRTIRFPMATSVAARFCSWIS